MGRRDLKGKDPERLSGSLRLASLSRAADGERQRKEVNHGPRRAAIRNWLEAQAALRCF